MKVVIAGPNDLNDYKALAWAIKDSGWWISEVINTGRHGVAELGEMYAARRRIPIARWRCDLKANAFCSKKASMIEALAEHADGLIALTRIGKYHKQTADFIRKFRELGKPVFSRMVSSGKLVVEEPARAVICGGGIDHVEAC